MEVVEWLRAGARAPQMPPAPAPSPGCPSCCSLYSGSLRLWVFSFLLISCFLDLTMAELLSVSLLKKAGGWLVLLGDLEPILLGGVWGSELPGKPAQH